MRNLRLYIADKEVDLDKESIILLNYTFEDLSNPTIVKNSYSKTIKLNGTPNNNRIFGDIYRFDRKTIFSESYTGIYFDATRKTPFTIVSELSEVLESGYVKLDKIEKIGKNIKYNITLFGGIGSFFYSLSYNEDGSKRTLADLQYIEDSLVPEDELDFVINAETIKDAWKNIINLPVTNKMWTIINFAPCYNGLPDDKFSSDKGLIKPEECGLPSTIDGFTTKRGYTLVSMPEKKDEWAVKDLRSYLQRPILSIRALLNAISNPKNNGGYVVDMNDILNESTFCEDYSDLWMTLPMLTSQVSLVNRVSDLSATYEATPALENVLGRYNVTGSDVSTISAKSQFRVKVDVDFTGNNQVYLQTTERDEYGLYEYYTLFAIQLVAKSSDGSAIGGSDILLVNNPVSEQSFRDRTGFIPLYNDGVKYKNIKADSFQWSASDNAYVSDIFSMSVNASGVSSYEIYIKPYSFNSGSFSTFVEIPTIYLYRDRSESVTLKSKSDVAIDEGFKMTALTGSQLFSNMEVNKKMLLSTSNTPAEYLLSFCATFGLYMVYDKSNRKITVLTRNHLFRDNLIDITDRIDTTGNGIVPYTFDAKWYELGVKGFDADFEKSYHNLEGRDYGIQRINTGFSFNSEVKPLLKNNVFRNAVTSLESGKYFTRLTKQGTSVVYPSSFIDKGNRFTLWNNAGETKETDIAIATDTLNIQYYNPTFKGYDFEGMEKVQLHDSSNKQLTGNNVLLQFEGGAELDFYKITDDDAVMAELNDGKPCWLLGDGILVEIPKFSRSFIKRFSAGLDFGEPLRVNIPNKDYKKSTTIYEMAWKAYLTDRFNVDTKVVRLKLDLSGVNVGYDLFRNFYWFGNSVWVLNKIIDYSMTTYNLTECEFVKVQDKRNYISGQKYGK